MRRLWVPAVVVLAVLSLSAGAQTPPQGRAVLDRAQAELVLNRIGSTYRAMQSYRDTATWTRKVGDKETTATVSLAVQRPNKYLLEVKGGRLDTVVTSDGTSLLALRPDRKAYIKTKPPQILMHADILGSVDVPSPGARLITLLLEANLHNPNIPFAKDVENAEISAPQEFGDKQAYVLTFRYDEDFDAQVYVTKDDYLIRRVSLLREGAEEIVENHNDIEVDKPIPADTFTRALPDNALMVTTLPPLQKLAAPSMAADFTVETYSGDKVSLSDYRGKIVVLDFWATWSDPSQRSLEQLEKVYKRIKNQGVVVLAVCVLDDRNAYDTWMAQNKDQYTFDLLYDPAGKSMSTPPANRNASRGRTFRSTPLSIATRLYRIGALPTTFVIDKDAQILASFANYKAGDRRLEDTLKGLGIVPKD